VSDIIAHALMPNPDAVELKRRVKVLTDAFPLYNGLEQ
jgi:glycine hydroxymethyltransferase